MSDYIHHICVELMASVWVPAVVKACLDLSREAYKTLISRPQYNVGLQKTFF